MKSTEEFWSKRQQAEAANVDQWLLARKRIGKLREFLAGSVCRGFA
jgi:hypothetical protein